ncbi:hypothetical protein BH09BAC6_BH09BAC6_18350 [soil metagenome]
MNLIPEQLQLFVSDSLNPQKFAGHHLSNKEFENWQAFLATEVANLKSLSASFPDPNYKKGKAAIITILNHIVDLSNTINHYFTRLHSIWKEHPQAVQIKSNYLFTLNAFEDLLYGLSKSLPQVRNYVKASNYSLPRLKTGMKERLKLLSKHFDSADIDEELKELVLTAFAQFIVKRNIRGIDEDYFYNLSTFLLNKKELDTGQLTDLLITHNFNMPEFFRYCVNAWRKRMADIPGLHEQQEMLLTERDFLYNLHITKGLKMPDASSVLYEDLDKFLVEKYVYIKQLLKIRREAIMDKEKAKAGIRFLMNLPVPQFGLFIRMQIEKGLLPKENVGDLFHFFALHFYTPHTLFMSAESLQKKSTDVEFSTAQKMKGQLIGMLNWLNANFNLSNYN